MFASTQNFSRTFAGLAGTLLFAGLCVGAATAPAHAASPTNTITYSVNAAGERTALVSFDDLNLNSAKGRSSLETRLRIAARTVCNNGRQDPIATAQADRCYDASLRATRNATMAAIAADKQVG